MTPPPDRAAILRRRAYFVSSTLTALTGCAAPNTAAQSPPAPTATIESPAPAAPETDPVADVPPPQAETPHPQLPPLDVPPGVNDIARQNYEQLAKSVPELHAKLDAIEKNLPTCATQKCTADWRSLAEALLMLDRELGHLGPRCRGSSEDAKAFDERLEQHRELLGERRARIDARLKELAASAADQSKWAELQKQAEQAHPMPCLRYACPEW